MKKKLMALALAVLMLTVAVVGGTMAYFTDTDSATNVMTIGKVDIQQLEQERNAEGEIVDFTQNKPLLPAVYDELSYVDGEINGYNVDMFDCPNVIDKFISVKNTGKSDAYVRTIVALEAPENFNDDLYGVLVYNDKTTGNVNTTTSWKYVTVGNQRYVVTVLTYKDALEAGSTSGPSFGQLYLNKDATNADVELLGSECTILAVSQAVQADGFETPADAFRAAFDNGAAAPSDANLANWLAAVA